jgi:hypothetical protein
MSHFSRRGFLKGLAAGTGALIGSRFPGASWIGEAKAADPPASVVIVYLIGGYNSIFASADSIVGKFGVTAGNHTVLGNGLAVDNVYANNFSKFALNHMAAVGVRHGITAHVEAVPANWSYKGKNAAFLLASEMGGAGATKAALLKGPIALGGRRTKVPLAEAANVSFDVVNDIAAKVKALGGGPPDPRAPDRTIALSGMQAARAMSDNSLQGSPQSLVTLGDGYDTAIGTLSSAPVKFDLPSLDTAYKLGGVTAVNSFATKMCAAEVMVRSGTNVVGVLEDGWDTHNDVDGVRARNKMRAIIPAMSTFVERMVQDETRNVTLVIMGDFSRSLPGSDHQPNLSATVIGRNVKQGTTGKTDNRVGLPSGTPNIEGLWSYLATLTKVPKNPFGANPHAKLVL